MFIVEIFPVVAVVNDILWVVVAPAVGFATVSVTFVKSVAAARLASARVRESASTIAKKIKTSFFIYSSLFIIMVAFNVVFCLINPLNPPLFNRLCHPHTPSRNHPTPR